MLIFVKQKLSYNWDLAQIFITLTSFLGYEIDTKKNKNIFLWYLVAGTSSSSITIITAYISHCWAQAMSLDDKVVMGYKMIIVNYILS